MQFVTRVHSQPVVRVMANSGRVDDSKPHTVILLADSSHGTIQLDDGQQHSFIIALPTTPAVDITTSSVYLGSPTHSSVTLRRYLSLTGFVGCIQVN